MKKYFITALVFLATTAAFAQKKHSKTPKDPLPPSKDTTVVNKTLLAPAPTPAATDGKPKKDWSKINLTKRSADHFMFQVGYDNWAGKPDSIHIQGFNRSANFYVMFDFPFKTDPRLSIGAGLGIGSSNIFFNQQRVLVSPAGGGASTLGFPSDAGGDHWKKYKLVTTYLESPVELRFAVDPEHMDQSWKFAIGVKVGLLMSAYTKAKDKQNAAGQIIQKGIEKESSTQFFNTPRIAGTARISKGMIGIFGQISGTSLIKASAGPSVFPFSMGITLSGL